MQRSNLVRFAAVITLLLVAMVGAAQTAKEENERRKHENALIAAYNDAAQAKDWARALAVARQIVDTDPSWPSLQALATAQLNSGAYEDALATYERAIQLAEAEQPVTDELAAKRKEALGNMFANKGNALMKLHRNSEAVAAFSRAAEFDPKPAIAYFNLCATQYNNGEMGGAVASCRKCLAIDPTKADAYFILGSALFADGKTDRNGKFIVPPEAIAALRKYLELAPNGPHVADVKAMLEMAK